MVRRIFSFSTINLLVLPVCISLQAQNAKSPEESEENIPVYNGVYIGTDIYGIGNRLLGSDSFSAEISVDVNLKRKYFPVLEIGYGTTDAWGEAGTHYKSNAPYFRIGMNYNSRYRKNNESHWYAGIRYGTSGISYDVEQLSVKDPVWNESTGNNPALKDDVWRESIPYNYTGLKGSMQWFELVAGVRVQIHKNFMMGWSVRMKYRTSVSTSEYGNLWYVPGFGIYGSSNTAINYSLIYKLPF
ncbi:hypothetical protein EZS27_025969 [termite gut metagenome]|uniref:Outer membrane protein beta-barrel domain-containing protein n=1 Tax=termite gut metagenome TaxID=433724 RepID=A0A5J4QUC9_9ZZZZ